jgi:ketosteroid isomerase-like protein
MTLVRTDCRSFIFGCPSQLRQENKGDTPMSKRVFATVLMIGSFLALLSSLAATSNSATDEKTVGALDTQYQAAVRNNDAATMDRILADGFVVVLGSGKTYTKADLLQAARTGRIQYEHQEDSDQTVRVWGDTAVVTAKLWTKGADQGKPFEFFIWFSDTYVRTAAGWRYVHGQASLPLPNPAR